MSLALFLGSFLAGISTPKENETPQRERKAKFSENSRERKRKKERITTELKKLLLKNRFFNLHLSNSPAENPRERKLKSKPTPRTFPSSSSFSFLFLAPTIHAKGEKAERISL